MGCECEHFNLEKNRIYDVESDKLITTEYTADGKDIGLFNGSFFIGEDLSMFTWRLKVCRVNGDLVL